jgi:hypothetical protein
MSKPWRVAKSLAKLRKQIDAAWPQRSKTSDGTVGDTAHAATASDHNPNKAGVVCAFDITHHPAAGVNCTDIANAIALSRDPRVNFIIWNGQIMSGGHSDRAWKWREYKGKNPHTQHMHVSVYQDPKLYDQERDWLIEAAPTGTLTVNGKRLPLTRDAKGTSLAPVRALAEALGFTVDFDAATGNVVVRKP